MDALIVFVVMHCGVPEAIVVDMPDQVIWDEVSEDERGRASEFIQRVRTDGARVIVIEVKDDKCAVST